ncbi:XRE family transcriptional regulator [Microvirga sp. 3-52]|nr:XRE family transcriptional regulator [Microvirga sp. 3-52]
MYEGHPTPVSYARFDARPRRGLRRDDAAHYVGVSASKFDTLVADGRMPAPFPIDGCVMWDIRKLDAAFDLLSDPQEAANGREIEL